MSIFSYKKIVNNTTYMNRINPIATFCGLVLFANHNYVNTTVFVNTTTILFLLKYIGTTNMVGERVIKLIH